MRRRLYIPIVEGHGEIEAVPRLIRRIYEEFVPGTIPIINPPIRIKAGSFLNDTLYFQKYVQMAAAKAAQSDGEVLILLDCEDECPATLGPDLLAKAKTVRPDVLFKVVLAHREYETWFLAAAESLRGCAGLPNDLLPPANPEHVRGAKEWLGRHMGQSYDPIIHHASFTAQFDLGQAKAVSSFDRFISTILS
ncbi:MAG: DUF4276 family protein [Verrucomicrobia bacterium]|nr:DUF4276 family protein [Verrucomicrobiota bacterium]